MPSSSLIDFSTTPLSESYSTFYAKILDDVFTPEECQQLISRASSTTEGWQPAGLNVGPDPARQPVYSSFRNSERVYIVDDELSGMIYERLRPLVEEDIGVIEPHGEWSEITGKAGRKQGPTWRLIGINSRLSFLRYGPGHFFKPHCDGLNESPDGKSKSFVTLHLYLTDETTESNDEAFYGTVSANKTKESSSSPDHSNGIYDTPATYSTLTSESAHHNSTSGADGRTKTLVGGTTRFWSPDKKHFLDVEPKIGRVLVFQQRMLVHSGEEVQSGMKYTMRGDFMFQESNNRVDATQDSSKLQQEKIGSTGDEGLMGLARRTGQKARRVGGGREGARRKP